MVLLLGAAMETLELGSWIDPMVCLVKGSFRYQASYGLVARRLYAFDSGKGCRKLHVWYQSHFDFDRLVPWICGARRS